MKVLIILALGVVPCWLLWSHIKETKAKDAAQSKGKWGDPSGGTGPSDDSPKWGGEPDEAHDDDLEKPKAKKPKAKAKKPKAKAKKKKTGAKRGRPRKKKDPEKDVGEK